MRWILTAASYTVGRLPQPEICGGVQFQSSNDPFHHMVRPPPTILRAACAAVRRAFFSPCEQTMCHCYTEGHWGACPGTRHWTPPHTASPLMCRGCLPLLKSTTTWTFLHIDAEVAVPTLTFQMLHPLSILQTHCSHWWNPSHTKQIK